MELLLRVIDKAGYDPQVHTLMDVIGDVIIAFPDGWNWSLIERTHPEWRIVRANLLQSEVDALLVDRRAGEIMTRYRDSRIDVTLIADILQIPNRVDEIIVLTQPQNNRVKQAIRKAP